MLTSTRERLKRGRYLSLPGELSLLGRTIVLREILKPTSARSERLRVPLKRGRLCFDARHPPDWKVYEEVFVERGYTTDFRDSVVIDIGAHRGIFSAFALLNGARAVLAYEPAPLNCEYLEDSLRSFLERGDRAVVNCCAVGGEAGVRTLNVYDESWSHSLLKRNDKTLMNGLEVSTISLASALAEARSIRTGSGRIVVKIDAEGSEYDMLLRAAPSTLALIDELFLEVHWYAEGDPTALVRHLRESGFNGLCDVVFPSEAHTKLHLRRTRASKSAA